MRMSRLMCEPYSPSRPMRPCGCRARRRSPARGKLAAPAILLRRSRRAGAAFIPSRMSASTSVERDATNSQRRRPRPGSAEGFREDELDAVTLARAARAAREFDDGAAAAASCYAAASAKEVGTLAPPPSSRSARRTSTTLRLRRPQKHFPLRPFDPYRRVRVVEEQAEDEGRVFVFPRVGSVFHRVRQLFTRARQRVSILSRTTCSKACIGESASPPASRTTPRRPAGKRLRYASRRRPR